MALYRKAKLNDNSAFLQFNWKADVVESWIGMYNLFVLFVFARPVHFFVEFPPSVLNLAAFFVCFR